MTTETRRSGHRPMTRKEIESSIDAIFDKLYALKSPRRRRKHPLEMFFFGTQGPPMTGDMLTLSQ